MKDKKSLGIYIHIPFCVSKCSYCSFVSFCENEQVMKNYVNALLVEISSYSSKASNYIVDTVYIGGGTPSLIFYGAISHIISGIKKYFEVSNNAEITIECNPNSLTIQKLREYKKSGINRISIGLQTYNDRLLKQINRPHTKKDFINAIKKIKIVGFENISTDVLLGLPNQSKFSINRTLNKIIRLKIPHISTYSLILEEGTKLHKQVSEKKFVLPSEDEQVSQYDLVVKKLAKLGYSRYEVSNFCKNGFESKHNMKYWRLCSYIGLGVASHSYFENERYHSFDNLEEYIDYYKVSTDNSLTVVPNTYKKELQTITTEDSIEEFVMLGLRTSSGISLIEYKTRFNCDLLTIRSNQIEKLKQQNLIRIENDRLFLTDGGFHLLNQIILELI